MQIDHIALYTRDLERLCEFYTKYFDGTAGKLYQNEETMRSRMALSSARMAATAVLCSTRTAIPSAS